MRAKELHEETMNPPRILVSACMTLSDEATTRRKRPRFMALSLNQESLESKIPGYSFKFDLFLSIGHYDPTLRTSEKLCKFLIYFIFSQNQPRINCSSVRFASSFPDYLRKRYLPICRKRHAKFGLVQRQDKIVVRSALTIYPYSF